MMLKLAARVLSPPGERGRLTILIFHRVLPRPDPLFPGEPDLKRFCDILSSLGRWFEVLPLDEALGMLRQRRLPARAVAITFDDGYADNLENAMPALKKYGFSATFFVAFDFLNGGRMWNDSVIEAIRNCPKSVLDLTHAGLGFHPLGTVAQRRHAIDALIHQIKYLPPLERQSAVNQVVEGACAPLPNDLMMRSDQVLALRDAGMQIGAHTLSHPILSQISDEQARTEIQGGKTMLESLLNQAVTLFAYPNGKPQTDYTAAHVRMVREAGYAAAVTTAPGAAMHATDFFQLPRFSPWDPTPMRYGLRLLSNLGTSVSRVNTKPESNPL